MVSWAFRSEKFVLKNVPQWGMQKHEADKSVSLGQTSLLEEWENRLRRDLESHLVHFARFFQGTLNTFWHCFVFPSFKQK